MGESARRSTDLSTLAGESGGVHRYAVPCVVHSTSVLSRVEVLACAGVLTCTQTFMIYADVRSIAFDQATTNSLWKSNVL